MTVSNPDARQFYCCSDNRTITNPIASYVVENVADLRAMSTSLVQLNEVAQTLGYYAAGDGGGNLFYWNATGVDVDNNGSILKPADAATGKWMALNPDFNVKKFGAFGDNATNYSSNIQDAIDAAALIQGSVVFEDNIYVVSGLTITNPVSLVASDASKSGVRFHNPNNEPTITITSPCTVDGIQFTGSYEPAKTNQHLIYVNNTSDVYLRNLFLNRGYNNIKFVDTCFFCYLENVRFADAVNALLMTDGTSGPGNFINIRNCIVNGGDFTTEYGFLFKNLGSLMISNLLFGHSNVTNGGIIFSTVASLYGATSIIGAQIEAAPGPAIHAIGTSLAQVNYLFMTNAWVVGGSASRAAIELEWVGRSNFDSIFTSRGCYGFWFKKSVTRCRFSKCHHYMNNEAFSADTDGTIVEDIVISDSFTAATTKPLVRFAATTPLFLGDIIIRDSTMGNTSAINIQRPEFNDGPRVKIDCPGYNKGKLTAPAMGASGADIQNNFDVPVTIYVTGVLDNSLIDGYSTVSTANVLRVQAGGAIRLVYSGAAPTWTWFGE